MSHSKNFCPLILILRCDVRIFCPRQCDCDNRGGDEPKGVRQSINQMRRKKMQRLNTLLTKYCKLLRLSHCPFGSVNLGLSSPCLWGDKSELARIRGVKARYKTLKYFSKNLMETRRGYVQKQVILLRNNSPFLKLFFPVSLKRGGAGDILSDRFRPVGNGYSSPDRSLIPRPTSFQSARRFEYKQF